MQIKLGWLFPRLLNTYGDRGNVLVLQQRILARGIDCKIIVLDEETPLSLWTSCDLLVGGGGQDFQQNIAMRQLQKKEYIDSLNERWAKKVPGLFTCALFQMLGTSYQTAESGNIAGLGIIRCITTSCRIKRACGPIVIKMDSQKLISEMCSLGWNHQLLIGFENHAGATFLHKESTPLGRVIKGQGNNGVDGTEGALFGNSICSYMHGPLLPHNPFLADWLIQKALQVKYDILVPLKKLDDCFAMRARLLTLKRLGIVA